MSPAERPLMTEVHADPIRGHIRVGDLVFCDVTATLDVWARQSIRLDTPTARALGEALVAWADRRDAKAVRP
jgi:hypothetical protein